MENFAILIAIITLVLDFFPVNSCVHRIHWTNLTGSSFVHNQFKVCSVSCTLSLVITNTPGTAKVLGPNLTTNSFFQTVIVLVQKKIGFLFDC